MDFGSDFRAMILCAGYGTRLGELTREVPKSMLLLHGKPLLEYIILNLSKNGFKSIVVNLHFMPEKIKSFFGDGSRWNVEIKYSHEDVLLGTAGGLKKNADFLSEGELFLVHYGDILTDQDLTSIVKYHRLHSAIATFLLHRRSISNSIVSMDSKNRIIGFLERPASESHREIKSPWVNSGVCVCSLDFLEMIPEDRPTDIPKDIIPKLIHTGRIYGFPLTGYRCAIDSIERLAEARLALAEGRCRI